MEKEEGNKESRKYEIHEGTMGKREKRKKTKTRKQQKNRKEERMKKEGLEKEQERGPEPDTRKQEKEGG